MNTDLKNPARLLQSASAPNPSAAAPINPPPSPTAAHSEATPAPPGKRRRRTGKIAALPKATRDQINTMIQDGLTYAAIIQKLTAPGMPPLPYTISESCLSEWKNGGYQDWLDDQFWAHEMRLSRESFTGVFSGEDTIQLPESGLQIAVTGLCELLRDLSQSHPDPDKYVRAANTLGRLSRSVLQLQQYRDACAKARAALDKLQDPNRELTLEERRSLVREVDKLLGLDADYEPTPGEGGVVSLLGKTAPVVNPAIVNPAIANPAIANPAIANPAIANPAIANPAIVNPAIVNSVPQPSTLNPQPA